MRLCSRASNIALAAGLLLVSSVAEAQANPKPDVAANTSGSAGPLEDIVVTAQRRSETAQSTPLALTAIAGDSLNQGITNVAGLQGLVPSTQFLLNQNNSMNVSIRGITTTNVQIVGDAAIAYNFDGTPITHSVGQPGGLYDLERIEVLRGPQGTLYGRNATGGAVNIITNKPVTGDLQASVLASYGNYDTWDVAGMINLPIGENFAVRAVAEHIEHNGYTDDGFNDQDTTAARIGALFDNGSILRVFVGADYTKQQGKGAAFTPCPPGSEQAGPALPPVLPNYCTGVDWKPFAGGPTDEHTDQNFVDVDNVGVYAEVNLDLPFGTLTYIPNYRSLTQRSLGYSISTAPTLFTAGDYVHTGIRILDDTDEVQSHELRLSSLPESRAKWVAGLFYLDDQVQDFRNSETNLPIFGPATATGIRVFAEERKQLTTKSYAAFGQVTYPVVDALRLTAGLRYTSDDRSSRGQSNVYQADGSIVPVSGVGDLSYKKLTWRAGFDADLAPHSLLFGSISTGYKSGGFNPGVQPNLFPPETVTAYELGIKNEFFDRRLRLNVTGFYYNYSNYQFSFFGNIPVPNPGSPGGTIILLQQLTAPAAKAVTKGIEVEAAYRLSSATSIDLSANYLKANFKEFTYDSVNYSGNPLPFSPEWTISGGLKHRFDLASSGSLTANIHTEYSSKQRTYYYDAPGSIQGSYTRTDFSLTYATVSEGVSVSAWAHNIENSDVIVQFLAQSALSPTVGLVAPPRTYGVTLSAHY